MSSSVAADGLGSRIWTSLVRPGIARLPAYLASIPLSLLILAILVVLAIATGSFAAGPPEEILGIASVSEATLRSGQWWALFTSMFFTTNPVAFLTAALMLVVLMGMAERTFGSLRTLIFFAGSQFAAVTLFLLITQLAAYVGDTWLGSMTDQKLIGPYGAILGVSLAASGQLSLLWRRRLRTAVLALALLLVLYVGHPESVIGLLGAVVGLVASAWQDTVDGRSARHRSTGRERRNLLAVITAIFALGPILAAVTRTPTGPLALLRDVILNPLPTLGQLEADCGSTVGQACLEAGNKGLAGPLALFLAVVPVVLLLICADGIRRGRRMALHIAVLVQLMVAALASVYLALFAIMPQHPLHLHAAALGSGFVHVLPLVIVPLVLAGLLWGNRRQFRVDPDPTARRLLLRTVGGTLALLAGTYTVLWFIAGGVDRDGGLLGLVSELARQYLPLPIPHYYRTIFANRFAVEYWLFSYSGIIFWTVALTAVWIVLLGRRPLVDAAAKDRDEARTLLRKGGQSLSWMALWEPNRYWFTSDRTGAVAFQQHGQVALTLAGPFGEAAGMDRAAAGFLDFCSSQALVPAFYSCDDALWPLLQTRGYHRVSVAQETRLAIKELEFKGKEWQNVRTAINRARKSGVTAVWGTYRDFSASLRSQLSELSEDWAAGKAVPEMGFTLGGIDDLMDDDVLTCLAVDPQGQVQGVTSWLPVYEDGVLVSRTLDVMRRRGAGFPGVMEFLIASAVQELRPSVDIISLSGSPLSRSIPENEADPLSSSGAGALVAILDVVGHALEPLYGFRSLAAFKSRFQPEYRTLYLYYQDPLQLAAIAGALTRAYLPGLSLAQSAKLLGHLVN